MLRQCPVCERDSIIGHGRRRKQAHDEHHDWIGIRRGLCPGCGKTFTPPLSPPYTHYSLLARAQALRRRFMEHCSWEEATHTLKDPDRVPDRRNRRTASAGVYENPVRDFTKSLDKEGWGTLARKLIRRRPEGFSHLPVYAAPSAYRRFSSASTGRSRA
jgi:hypothetical protein